MPKKNISFEELLGITKDPMIKVAIERLRPPREVEKDRNSKGSSLGSYSSSTGEISPSNSKTSEMDKLDPEYKVWCLSLETQRHYYYTKFGKVHRKDSNAVKRDLKNRGNEIKMIELMKTNKKSLYADCMRELKEGFKKRNE